MSRLHAGGLALIIGYDRSPHNLGCVVRLIEFYPVAYFEDGEIKTNAWRVFSNDLIGSDAVTKCPEMIYRQEHLQALGDDKGIELYRLREEQKELN